MEERNVDTDKIIPARFLRKARGNGLQQYLFHDIRFASDGSEIRSFVLNQDAYRDAQILVAGENFGCGSSREAAVYVLLDYGIRAIIAPSFGDIFYGNLLQNGVLPAVAPRVTCETLWRQLREKPGVDLDIDLADQIVTGPDGVTRPFAIDAAHKERLLNGLDDVALVLHHLPEIEAFERRYRDEFPWRK